MDTFGRQAIGPTESMVISGSPAPGSRRPSRDSFGLLVTGGMTGGTMVGTAVIGVPMLDSTAVSIMASAIMAQVFTAAGGRAARFTIIPRFGE
jgi:hypothetical protein